MIVCSCNVLSDTQILATLRTEEQARPRSPVQAYSCLGCAPRCGRCLTTVRRLLAEARMSECNVGCAACPAHAAGQQYAPANDDFHSRTTVTMDAAE